MAIFGRHEYMRNRFAGINHRNTVGAGLAYTAIKSARQTLALDAGFGYAGEKRLVGANLSSATGTANLAYKVSLSDTAVFEDELAAVTSFSTRDQRVTNIGSLTARLTTMFSLKVRHTTRWVRSPVPGFRRTDTTSSVALVAKF
jgi:putative salt-induced outer membrane protein YdiY